MVSIVIAAHNEAAVIGRTLDVLLSAARPGEFDVTVVTNGCTDDTATVASTRSGVRVVELAESGKANALNAGDRVANGFPRVYLDADILATADVVRKLSRAVTQQSGADSKLSPLAAVPRRELELTGRPLFVRGYFAINTRLPVFRDGLFGRGMIMLSAEGRARFDQFPDMIADDLFLDSQFAKLEKCQVGDVATVVAAPLRARDLIRRLVRVRRGNAAMRGAGRTGEIDVKVRKANRLSWFWDVVVPDPRLAPAAIAYVLISVSAAVLARRKPNPDNAWGQDNSTRGGNTARGQGGVRHD